MSVSSFNYFRGDSPSDSVASAANIDRFLNESLDDETRADCAGSSTVGSSAVVELRRRESSSQRDDVGALNTFDPFRPRLLDEDLATVKSDDLEEVASYIEGVPLPFGVVGPAPHVVDRLGPTRANRYRSSVDDALSFCGAPSTLETQIPFSSERQWTTPEGFICVYEKFFTECRLFFPIPGFLLEYVARREIAFSQLSVAVIRNAVGLIQLAGLCGITVRCSLFEELTSFKGVGKKLGIFYAQSSGAPKLVLDAKSKTYD